MLYRKSFYSTAYNFAENPKIKPYLVNVGAVDLKYLNIKIIFTKHFGDCSSEEYWTVYSKLKTTPLKNTRKMVS